MSLLDWLPWRRKQARLAELEDARQQGRDEGFNAGMMIGGHHIARTWQVDIHGFGFRCIHCGVVNGCLVSPDREYVRCRNCKKRHPAPLAPGPDQNFIR